MIKMDTFQHIQDFFGSVLSITVEHEHDLTSTLISRESLLSSSCLYRDSIAYVSTHISKPHRALRLACAVDAPNATQSIRVIRQICAYYGYVWEPVRYFSHIDKDSKKKIMLRAFRCYPSPK